MAAAWKAGSSAIARTETTSTLVTQTGTWTSLAGSEMASGSSYSRSNVVSSTVILVGYAIPGFVLGITLLVLFGGGSFWDVFPLRGLVSDNWQQLDGLHKITDYLWHMTLPIIASVVGSFAVMTMLTNGRIIAHPKPRTVCL